MALHLMGDGAGSLGKIQGAKEQMVFETERLILRKINRDDFENWYEILSDAKTMRYYPAPYDRAGVQRWMDWTLDNYARYGFGLWAVILKENGRFIGDCGITMQNIHGQMLPEIGYHIHKDYWRRGYASKAALKCMEFAFEICEFPAVYSYMKHDNAASWGVAVKNGMHLIEEYADPVNEKTRVYAITREEWMRRRI